MKTMKRTLLFAGLAVAALSFVGCNKQESDSAGNDSQVAIRLVTPETKTVNTDWSTFWAEGDALSVFYSPSGGVREYSDNIKFEVTSPDDGIARADVTLAEGTYDWFAFYPYNSYFPSPANGGYDPARTYIGCRSDKAQVQEGYSNMAHVAGPDVPLYGIVMGVPSTSDPEIQMKHVASLAEILVTNESGEPVTITGIELSAPEGVDIVGYYNISFDDEPVITPYDEYQSNTAKLTVTEGQPLPNNAYAKFYLVVKPFEADELTVKVITDAGSQEKTKSLPSTVTFNPGHIKTLNFAFEGGSTSSSTIAEMLNLTDGEDVLSNEVLVVAKASTGVLVQEGDDYILVYGKNAVADVQVGDMVVVEGKMATYSGARQISSPIVTVKSSGNPVTYPTATDITDDFETYAATTAEYVSFTGVLTVSGSYFNVKVGDITARIGSVLTPAGDDADALKEMNNKRVQVTGYYLYMTSSNKYFNVIATDVEAVGGAVDATIDLPRKNITMYVGDVRSLEATTNSTASITYTSSDSSIASVDSDGNVTAVAEGEATITLYVPEVSGEFTDVEEEVSIIVLPQSGTVDGTWVMASLADISDGDQFVIVCSKDGKPDYAMTSDGSASAQPKAVEVTISGSQLSSVAENIVWTMEKSGTSSYIFHPGSNADAWLYSTATNNGLRTGTGDAKVVVLDASGYLTMEDPKGDTRFIGVYYDNKDWRSYTTIHANIKDQTFTFFVKQ